MRIGWSIKWCEHYWETGLLRMTKMRFFMISKLRGPRKLFFNVRKDTTYTFGKNKTIFIRIRTQPSRAIYFKIKILHIYSTNKKCRSTRWLQKLQSCCLYIWSTRLGKFGFFGKTDPQNMSFNKQSLLCYWWANQRNAFSWWYNTYDFVHPRIGAITRMWLHRPQGLIHFH